MNVIHKRAYVLGRAVSYCQAASEGPQPTTTDKVDKVTCPRCKSIATGNG